MRPLIWSGMIPKPDDLDRVSEPSSTKLHLMGLVAIPRHLIAGRDRHATVWTWLTSIRATQCGDGASNVSNACAVNKKETPHRGVSFRRLYAADIGQHETLLGLTATST